MPATIRLRQAAGPQDHVELGPREGAVGGLVDDRLARLGGDRIDDGEARLAAHEKAAERPDLADLQEAGLDQRGAMRRQVGKVGTVALPRVDDGEAGAPRGRQEASRLGHRRADAAEVVAHGGEVAVIVDEVALHVDEDERGAVGGETAMGEAVRRGSDRERAHGAFYQDIAALPTGGSSEWSNNPGLGAWLRVGHYPTSCRAIPGVSALLRAVDVDVLRARGRAAHMRCDADVHAVPENAGRTRKKHEGGMT